MVLAQHSVATVPFTGCLSDGQLGPQAAPTGKPHRVNLPPQTAAQLAWYQNGEGFGILAPRGWHCLSMLGSDGTQLYLTPSSFTAEQLFSDTWKGFTGPAIQASYSLGDTSGRSEVAEVIARVFPNRMSFVRKVIAEGCGYASQFPKGPYPKDVIHRTGPALVEFTTLAGASGLGTASRLRSNNRNIHGFELLLGNTPDLLTVAVRLDAGHDADQLTYIVLTDALENAQEPKQQLKEPLLNRKEATTTANADSLRN